MGVKVGLDCKLYRNTNTYGSPTWNEVTICRDLTLDLQRDVAEATSRGSFWKFKAITFRDAPVEFDILADEAIDDYDVLRDAHVAGTVIDFAIANGAIATTGNKYFRADYYVTGFGKGQPMGDVNTTAVKLEMAYSSNAPGFTTVP